MLQRETILSLHGLANHLVQAGLLDFSTAQYAYQQAQQQQVLFISYIVKNNLFDSDVLIKHLSKTFNLETFDLDQFDTQWLTNLPLTPELIHHFHVIPLFIKNEITYFGVSDPTDTLMADTIAFHTGLKLKTILVAENKLSQIINKHYSQCTLNHNLQLNLVKQITHEESPLVIHENTTTYDEPLIQFTNNILKQAIHQSASDIHIEHYKNFSRIRFRQDGILHEISQMPTQLSIRMITRIKVLAKLDISERRLPQDGRFQFDNYDIRVSTCPTLHGEKIVLRLLNTGNMIHRLETLGFSETQLSVFLDAIHQPQGMILVTGPTGSGKTVTLYSALEHLNSPNKNISTVEDPIEIQLQGINQVNIHPKIDLHFSTILRSLLRQDPDIVMIGEIRDTETAKIAMQAAQTGHLVFSTLHTNSAIDAIARLRSMELTEFDIDNSVSLIVAQRLVRKLCSYCKQPDPVSTQFLQSIEFPVTNMQSTLYKALGCTHCLQGYQGRTGIFELLSIKNHFQPDENFKSLWHSGYEKTAAGLTSLAELNRVLQK